MFNRELRVRERTFRLNDGSYTTSTVAEEKGIDVRLALDVVRLALDDEFDVGILFSQDQDLSEAADEVRKISQRADRWIRVACAYPVGPGTRNRRGVNNTDWVPLDQETYNQCLDERDYRPTRG